MRNKTTVYLTAVSMTCLALTGSIASERLVKTDQNWVFEQTLTGFRYATKGQLSSRKGITRKGLLSVARAGGNELITFWEPGAFIPTVTLNDKKVVDGYDLKNVSRIRSIRLNKSGAVAYIKSGKGVKAKVELVIDGKASTIGKRQERVSLLSFKKNTIIFAKSRKNENTIRFFNLDVSNLGKQASDAAQLIGKIDECIFLYGKPTVSGLLLNLICDRKTGQGIYHMNAKGELSSVFNGELDDIEATSLLRRASKKTRKGAVGVLSVEGSADALHFYHAVNATLLKDLGEPMSVSSDEAGKQSWNQGYRTMAVAKLFEKTQKQEFATLARNAMENTLQSTNANLSIRGENNPDCGWASRIYSEDGFSPISFMINQAMIEGSLIRACRSLGRQCTSELKSRIDKNAICLVERYEKNFDQSSGLYRIPYGISFRFDGIWAPWNWQNSWAMVLDHAGKVTKNKKWRQRANSIVSKFEATITANEDGALWRYWTPQYYAGWKKGDDVSSHRPTFRPKKNERYEDINHAGISLLAACDFGLSTKIQQLSRRRLNTLLDQEIAVALDMDGRGSRSAKWIPAAGWDCLQSQRHKQLFTRILPSAAGGPKHLSYASFYDENAPFRLKLTLRECLDGQCHAVQVWKFNQADDYLAASPFFAISEDH